MSAPELPARQPSVAAQPKRPYAQVAIDDQERDFGLRLDEKPLLTPARRPLRVPTRALAELIASEWQAQPDLIDFSSMPITRLVNTGLDGVAQTLAAVQAEVASYARCDLLCYRAEAPESLVAAQARAWDPVLDWVSQRFGRRFRLASGIVFVQQPKAAMLDVQEAVRAYGPISLAGVATMTSLTGSVLLALALAEGALALAEGWACAHVDEDFQALHWGMDDEAALRRQRRFVDMQAAWRVVRSLAA